MTGVRSNGNGEIANGGERRKLLFIIITALLCAMIVEIGALAIEFVAHRLSGADESSNPYVALKNRVPVFELAKSGRAAEYRRTMAHWIYPDQHFLERKPAGTIRVFCLGGSAALGWPHPPQWSYPAILKRKLKMLFPERHIEVLNVAGNTYASYRVKVVFDEVLQYDPDLIIIYSGNNEFLENIVYTNPSELSPPWRYFAVARLVSRAFQPGEKRVVNVANYGAADQVVNRLSFAFGRASTLRSDQEQLDTVINHYRYNMESMLRSARQSNVEVMLVDVPVNLKDWIPNVSQHAAGLSENRREAFQSHFREGIRAVEAERFSDADRALSEALAIDATYAEAVYLRGVARHRLGQVAAARKDYLDALTYDAYPFRSLPVFDTARRDVAREFDVPIIETTRILEASAADGILGLDVLVDYVHPTVVSNEKIAHAVLLEMQRSGQLGGSASIPLDQARIDVPGGIEDSPGVLLSLYSQYLVMRQYDKLDALAQRAQAALRAPSFEGDARSMQQFLSYTLLILQRYRHLLRAEKLGILDEEFTQLEARRTYLDYVEMIRQIEARDMRAGEFQELVPTRDFMNNGGVPVGSSE